MSTPMYRENTIQCSAKIPPAHHHMGKYSIAQGTQNTSTEKIPPAHQLSRENTVNTTLFRDIPRAQHYIGNILLTHHNTGKISQTDHNTGKIPLAHNSTEKMALHTEQMAQQCPGVYHLCTNPQDEYPSIKRYQNNTSTTLS